MAALNLRDVLNEELATRAAAVPGYSLRKFAADLEVSPAQLSKVLSGKSTLSEEKISKISVILKWPVDLTNRAMSQARNIRGRRQISILNKQSQVTLLSDIEKESFRVISDWYHFAILELIHLKDFLPDIKYVSQRLNIDLATAQTAIHRLIDLKLLKINEDGSWEDSSRYSSTLKSFDTDLAMRQYQMQLFEKAAEAMNNLEFKDRSQTSVTFSVSRSQMAEAKEKVVAFQRALVASLQEASSSHDEVYQLTISMFPLTVLKEG